MAGINFYIEYREGERSLIKGLLTFLQQRAKSWKLEFRFNHDRSQYEVDMHGHLQDIQAFIVFINSSDTLQTYAAAFPQPNKPQTRLRGILSIIAGVSRRAERPGASARQCARQARVSSRG